MPSSCKRIRPVANDSNAQALKSFPLRGKQEMNPDRPDCEHNQRESTAFGPYRASGQPGWSMERRIYKMALRNKSTVRGGVEIGLSPIPSRVHSNRKPNVTSPLQTERCK